jgi:C4-type Zn-finger protein
MNKVSLHEKYQNKANRLLESDEEILEKFAVSHMRCPHCKVDLNTNANTIEVPTEKGKVKVGVDVTSCPKCGFIGDVEVKK